MASAGKWEVVGKSNKKKASYDKKKDKFKLADASMLDVANPVPEADTIYHAFDIQEKKMNKNSHFDPFANQGSEEVEEKPHEAKKGIKKKPMPSKPQKTEQQLLEEALEKVELDQLRNILAKDQVAFPNNPSLWLKDIASYLHLQLQAVPEKDPVFDDKPKDYPTCLLRKDVRGVIMTALKNSSPTTLDLFFQYSINEMVMEMSRGHSVYGLQIMLQCTVKSNPKIALNKLEEYEEMLDARKTRPKEALALMWTLGQLPDKNLAHGLTVWTRVMMPLLSTKQLSRYAINYLEYVLKLHNNGSNQPLLKPQDFFSIMAITFSSSSPLAGNHSLQRKMLALYPKLKAMTIVSGAQSSGRAYFLPLLSYLCRDDLSVEHLTEVLDCLTFCLEKDPECFSLWIERYPKSLQESSVVLYHIIDTWNTRSNKVNKAKFLQAVATFQVFNSENERSKQLPGLEDCIRACKAADDKTKSSSCFSFKCLFKLLVLVLIGVISYDVYKHHGYKGSKTAKFAQEYGIEQGATKVYGQAKYAFDKGNSWVQDHYPAYHSKFHEYADPAGRYAWEKLTIAGDFIAVQTKPARDYLNVKVPEVLEKIEKEVPVYWGVVREHVDYWWNKYWPTVHHHIMIVWEFLRDNVPPLIAKIQEFIWTLAIRIYELAPDFFNSVAATLEGLAQKIADKIPDVVAVVQEYAVIASNLAMNLINNVVTWLQSLAASGDEDVVMAQHASPSGPSSKTIPK